MTQPNDIEGLRKVAEEATPGEWRADRYDAPHAPYEVCAHDGSDWEIMVASCGTGNANARFIATFDPPTVLALLSELEAVKRDADLCAKSWVKEIESNNARQGELRAVWEMLNRYDAPTHDEGEEGGPLSLAGRIEAMVYRDAVRAEATLVSLKGGGGSSGGRVQAAPEGQHSAGGTCPTCHGSRRIHIVEGACTPAHDEDCPVCVGREIAPGVRAFVSGIPS